MYAVIFKATVNEFDESYTSMAKRMRDLATTKYGCTQFISCTESNQEIAISYWDTLEQIELWKQDSEHLAAQDLGISKWYKSYHVEVVEIVREYKKDT